MGFEFGKYNNFFRTEQNKTMYSALHFSLHFHCTLHRTSLKTIKGNKTWTPCFSLGQNNELKTAVVRATSLKLPVCQSGV